MVLMQIEAWDEAIKSCNNVLRVQPNNVKALFRKAKVSCDFSFFLPQSIVFMCSYFTDALRFNITLTQKV